MRVEWFTAMVPDVQPAVRALVIDLRRNSREVGQLLKSLASDKRLEILRHLAGRSSSVNEIADALRLPASTATMHIKLLEKAGLIRTELKPASHGLQKICYRLYDQIALALPMVEPVAETTIDVAMPVGAYVDCRVTPTCGLASGTGLIGRFDDPSAFYDPERFQAQLLWFRAGYVEYRFPNRLPPGALLESLQISLEMCSEAPLHKADWRSDITVWVNRVEVGTWTSPGDFGEEAGQLTPSWWERRYSQYGLLKLWKVTGAGAYLDGVQVADVTLDQLAIAQAEFISVRIGIKEDAQRIGGLNIFGRQFGNYPQDIVLRLRFREREHEPKEAQSIHVHGIESK